MNNYVYEIKNIKNNKRYIGVRSSKTFDLGIKYFSSSTNKTFIKDQKENPKDYIYIELANFKTRQEALEMEISLHEWYDIGKNTQFYNKAKQTSVGFDTTGIKQTEETIKRRGKKISAANKKRWSSLKQRKKQSEKIKETMNNEEYKNKCIKRNEKMWSNKDYKKNMSEKMLKMWSNKDYKKNMSEKMIKIWTDEDFKNKQNSTRKKNKHKHKQAKKVYLFNKITKQEKLFNTLNECSEYLKVERKMLSRYLKEGFEKSLSSYKYNFLLDYEGYFVERVEIP